MGSMSLGLLIESVRHHVEEEETQLFPEVRKAMGRKALGGIGDAMEEARKVAPSQPHPKAPDTPPANVAAGAGAASWTRQGTPPAAVSTPDVHAELTRRPNLSDVGDRHRRR